MVRELLDLVDRLTDAGPIYSLSHGNPNWIVARDPESVWVETEKSRGSGEGAQPIPWEWIEESYRTLRDRGRLVHGNLSSRAAYRSAFIFALLAQMDDVEASTRPIELRSSR